MLKLHNGKTYRPFHDGNEYSEFRSEWVHWPKTNTRALVTAFSDDAIFVGGASVGISFDYALANLEFYGGRPFGVECKSGYEWRPITPGDALRVPLQARYKHHADEGWRHGLIIGVAVIGDRLHGVDDGLGAWELCEVIRNSEADAS